MKDTLPNIPIMLNIIAQTAAMIVTDRVNGLKSPFSDAISKLVSFAAKCPIFQRMRKKKVLLPSHASKNQRRGSRAIKNKEAHIKNSLYLRYLSFSGSLNFYLSISDNSR